MAVFFETFDAFYIWGIADNDNITVRGITLHNFIMLMLRLGERPETCNKS